MDRSADRHFARRRQFQLNDQRWSEFDEKAKAVGKTRAMVTTELVLWWLGHRAKPPERPDTNGPHP